LAQKAAERRRKRETREARQRLKTRSQWLKEAQQAFNAYVRARDEGKPCISCGSSPNDDDLLTGSRFDCGHYRSTGAAPELRFHEDNAAGQCVKCNRHLSGNTVEMRNGLIQRIGIERVEALESDHPPRKYTIDDLKAIRDDYRRLVREMKKE
jgi:hypothetical protein